MDNSFVSYVGLASSAAGALCWGVAWIKGRSAHQLESAVHIDNFAGACAKQMILGTQIWPIISAIHGICQRPPLPPRKKLGSTVLFADTRWHAELRSMADAVPLLVAVAGQVWCAEPLQCELAADCPSAVTEVSGLPP